MDTKLFVILFSLLAITGLVFICAVPLVLNEAWPAEMAYVPGAVILTVWGWVLYDLWRESRW